MSDGAGTHVFTYDPQGALASADHPTASSIADEVFTYDVMGNRTSDAEDPLGTMTYDVANRLMSDARRDYAYDDEGDLVKATERSTGAVTRYTWDPEHRMTAVSKPDGAHVDYRYDAFGHRVQAVRSDGKVMTWGYDGGHVAAIWRNQAGELPQLSETFVTTPWDDPLEATRLDGPNAEVAYPVLDALGSVTATLDQSGTLTSTTAYSAFGTPHAATGVVGLDDSYAYTGHAWNADTQDYYARARWLSPSLGRFTSEDPVQAPNLYAYADNEPLTWVDPTGEEAEEEALMFDLGAAEAETITGEVEYGSTELSQAVQQARIAANDRAGNYAAAQLRDGRIVIGRSSRLAGHAEESIINEYGVNQILRLFTEREPCAHTCAPLVSDIEEVTWSFQWNPAAVRDASNAALRAAIRGLFL